MRSASIVVLTLFGAAAALAYAETAADFNNQGIAAYDSGNYPLAINLFEQAYDGARDNDTVRHNLCNALQANANAMAKKADFANAAKQLETAIGVDPDNASPLMQLGAYYLRLDMVSDAILRLEEAIEIKPGDLDAHEMLGRAYYADNDPLNAMVQWEYVLQKDPGRKDLHELFAKAKRESSVESDFKRRGSKHFTVSFPATIPNDLRARVVSILESAYLQVGQKFGKVYPPTPIQVVAYGPGQFEEATKLDEHVGAVFDGKIRAPLTDKDGNYLPDAELKRRLTHEYVHVVIRHIAGANVPWWINEGFAETFSSDLDEVDDTVLTKSVKEKTFIPFAELQEAQLFKRKSESLQLAYSQAQAATTHLWHFGVRKLGIMMSDLAGGMPGEAALKKNYGRTFAQLDKEIADKYR